MQEKALPPASVRWSAWLDASGPAQVALLEEISGVTSRVVVQVAKDAVTQRLVKRECLELEGIEMRVLATAGMRLVLRCLHEAAPNTAAPDGFRHPKLFDEEPIPMCIAKKATNKLAVEAGKHNQIAVSLRCGVAVVVVDQRPHDLVTLLGRAVFFDVGLDFAHRRREEASNELKLSDAGWRRKGRNTEQAPPPASVRWSALLGAGVRLPGRRTKK